jgi:hypothetical protein
MIGLTLGTLLAALVVLWGVQTWLSRPATQEMLTQPKSGSYPVAGNVFGGLKVPSVGAILSLT